MVDWQAELDALLARMRVSSTWIAHSAADGSPLDGVEPPEMISPLDEIGADPLWSSPFLAADEPQESVEVSAVRTEIEATLRQVTSLTQEGKIEPRLRTDVIMVLYALTRPRPALSSARTVDSSQIRESLEIDQEWQLTSAAAVLRFCRLVTRLINELAADSDA